MIPMDQVDESESNEILEGETNACPVILSTRPSLRKRCVDRAPEHQLVANEVD